MQFFKSLQCPLVLKCLCITIIFPGFAFAGATSIEKTHINSYCYPEIASPLVPPVFNDAYLGAFELVFQGTYLSLYTSGRIIKQGNHPKSGVWNVPVRIMKEMWIKRAENSQLIRLDPKTFRQIHMLPVVMPVAAFLN